MLRDAYFPEGMPSFLGEFEWGAKNGTRVQIFRDSIFPVTPAMKLKKQRNSYNLYTLFVTRIFP